LIFICNIIAIEKQFPSSLNIQNNQIPYFVAFFYIIPESFFSESFIFAQKNIMLYIYGATAHAKTAVDVAEDLAIEIGGLIDKSLLIEDVFDYEVQLHHQVKDVEEDFFVAVKNPGLRERIVSENAEWNFQTLIHPKAYVSKRAEIGEGTIILPGASIAPDVQIGNHCIIAGSAVIESNTIIEDFVNIGPNVSVGANVLVGRGSEIKANTRIEDEETIPKESVIA
jgi:sugar O-acyltransferase (sialic acid O-acetyltransferase NeuD family)